MAQGCVRLPPASELKLSTGRNRQLCQCSTGTKGRKAIVHTLWLTKRSNGDFRCGYISFGRGQWSADQAPTRVTQSLKIIHRGFWRTPGFDWNAQTIIVEHLGYTTVHFQFNLASKNILHNRFNNNFVIAYSCTAMSKRDRKSSDRTARERDATG